MAERSRRTWTGLVATVLVLGLASPARAETGPTGASAPAMTRAMTGAERVAAITRRLLLAGTDRCAERRSDFGFDAAPASAASWGAAITRVWPDGAAARAGLQPGDLVQAVNGVPWSADHVERERFGQALAAAALAPQVTLLVQRADARRTIALPGTPRCHAEVQMSARPWINATAIDSTIIIGSGLERLLTDDAELAFAVAHEAAHILLGHTAPDRREAIGVAAQRRVLEREADAMAVRLMATAGYPASAAAAAWMKIADASRPPLVRLMDLHGPYMPTAERAAFLGAEAARAAAPPVPHLLAGHLSR